MTQLFACTSHGEGVVSLNIATDAQRHLDAAWVDGFLGALQQLGDDRSVGAVVLEGGSQYFSAGASRSGVLESVAAAKRYAARIPAALLALPLPVVAAMAGHAVGGGLVMGLWCDAAVLAAESLYGANFMALGFTPGMGAAAVVPESFGASLGRELLWTGRLITGQEIREARCPLSHAVRPRREVLSCALAVARDMADTPRAVAALFKQQLAGGRRAQLEAALSAEEVGHEQLLADPATRREIERRYIAASPLARGGADADAIEQK
jgi:polyketide biosynthesis enoyl-CoA hydratase PksI